MRWRRPPDPALSAARRRGWETRRKKYGPRGHNSTYSRAPVDLSVAVRCDLRLGRLVAVLLGDGILSEGQVARIIEMDRVAVRELCDDGMACLTYRPLTGAWGSNMMRRLGHD